MPQSRLSKDELFHRVLSAIRESGWNTLTISEQPDFSRRLRVYRDDHSFALRIYIWNVTHGGGQNRPANEYRIQVTPVSIRQFQTEPDGTTLILGYWQQHDVFAAWDYNRHSGQLGASPSFQISEDALLKARQNGMMPYEKGTGEIALAFRPDYFMEYVADVGELHELGQTVEGVRILEKAIEDPGQINDDLMKPLNEPRRAIARTVTQKLRRHRFRNDVLTAYSQACALCSLQLGLVEAAHIVPVFDARSQDVTSNGLALCILHHCAYDNGLVAVDVRDEEYKTLVNLRALNNFTALDLGGGRDAFMGGLRSTPILPTSRSDRPSTEMLTIANQLRRWDDLDPNDVQSVR